MAESSRMGQMKWSSSSSSLALDSLREDALCLRALRWAEGLLALPSSSMLNMSSSSMVSVAVLTTECENGLEVGKTHAECTVREPGDSHVSVCPKQAWIMAAQLLHQM